VATLGEEVRRPAFTIPRVLFGTVIGGGLVYTVVTVAEVLGFGTDAVGMKQFAASDSLLGGLGARYFGPVCGDLFDLLATFSALGCGLAAVLAASRVLFAIMRNLAPASPLARLSGSGGTPFFASLWVVFAAFLGYALMRVLFHGSGSDPFFWASTMGALGLLVAYFLVVLSAAVSLFRSPEGAALWKIVIPCAAACSIAYTFWVNVYPVQSGAYGVIPWVVVFWCLLPLFFLLIGKARTRRSIS
jgi:amino acid transporter